MWTMIRIAWKHAHVAVLSRSIAPFPSARPWATFPLDSSTLPLCRNNALSTTLLLGKILSGDYCASVRIMGYSMQQLATKADSVVAAHAKPDSVLLLLPSSPAFSLGAGVTRQLARPQQSQWAAAGKYSDPTLLLQQLTHPLNGLQRKEELNWAMLSQSVLTTDLVPCRSSTTVSKVCGFRLAPRALAALGTSQSLWAACPAVRPHRETPCPA